MQAPNNQYGGGKGCNWHMECYISVILGNDSKHKWAKMLPMCKYSRIGPARYFKNSCFRKMLRTVCAFSCLLAWQ